MPRKTVPDAVRKQAEEADKAFEQQTQKGAAPGEPENTTPPEPAPEAEPPAEPEETPAAGEDEFGAIEDPDELRALLRKERHKTEVVTGKYDAEVPKLAADLKQLRADDELRRAEIEHLKRQHEEAARAATPQEVVDRRTIDPFLTETDRQTFDEDMLDMVARAAHGLAGAQVDAVRGEMADLQKRYAESSTNSFWEYLDREVPDWNTLNTDPGFLDWLAVVDTLTGRTRKDLLDDARCAGNAKLAANFFKTYKAESGTGTEPQAPPPGLPPGQQEMEGQVAPAKGPAGKTPKETKKKVYSPAEINALADRITKGKVKGEAAEKLKKEIDLAWAENRVRATAA